MGERRSTVALSAGCREVEAAASGDGPGARVDGALSGVDGVGVHRPLAVTATTCLDADTAERLDTWRAALGLTRSQAIRELVGNCLR